MAKEDSNWFDRYTAIANAYPRAFSYTLYSVAVTGVVIIVRSVRPFSKFCRPSDIPASFYKKNIMISGRVVSLEVETASRPPLLLVDHRRIYTLPFQRCSENCFLPVEIASVNIKPLGTTWLNCDLVSQNVNLTLLRSEQDRAVCIVKTPKEKLDIGLQLVNLGFATVAPYDIKLWDKKIYSSYYKTLLVAENKAERKYVGIWQDNMKVSWLQKVIRFLWSPSSIFYKTV